MSITIIGVAVYRRAVSKKLVFYDLELAESARTIELVLKVGAFDVEGIKLLRDTIRLGDTLLVTGSWQQPARQQQQLQLQLPHGQHQQLGMHSQPHQQHQEAALAGCSADEAPPQPQPHPEFLATSVNVVRRWQHDHPHDHFIPRPSRPPQRPPSTAARQHPSLEPAAPPQPPNHPRPPSCLPPASADVPPMHAATGSTTCPSKPIGAATGPQGGPIPSPPPCNPSRTLASPSRRSETCPAPGAPPTTCPAPAAPASSHRASAHPDGVSQSPAPPSSTHAEAADPLLGTCKFWVNSRSCSRGAFCPYAHPAGPDRHEVRRQWERSRGEERVARAREAGLHRDDSAATKAARARVFAEWLVGAAGRQALAAGSGVLDVAGGRGAVSFELATRYNLPTLLVEPRPAKLTKAQLRRLPTVLGASGVPSAASPSPPPEQPATAPSAASPTPPPEQPAAAPASAPAAVAAGRGGAMVGGRTAVAAVAAGHGAATEGGWTAVAATVAAERTAAVAEAAPAPGAALTAVEAGGATATGAAALPAAAAVQPADGGQERQGPQPHAEAAAAPLAHGAEPLAAPSALPAAAVVGLASGSRGAGDASATVDECRAGAAGWQVPQLRELFGPELWRQGPHWERLQACSMVVGMHPDEATEAILEFALECNKPFAIVPCCVFPRQFTHRRLQLEGGAEEAVESYQQLVAYLAQKGGAQVACLGFQGANCVVFRLPDT